MCSFSRTVFILFQKRENKFTQTEIKTSQISQYLSETFKILPFARKLKYSLRAYIEDQPKEGEKIV